MGRFIGIIHRVKYRVCKGEKIEARPTLVYIMVGRRTKTIELRSETDELDFLLGRLPVKYREYVEGEDLSIFVDRHIKRDLKGTILKVPSKFEGLTSGDTVAMCMGGSGDRFGYAIALHGFEIGVRLLRIKPSLLKELRGHEDTSSDHKLLAELVKDQSELFEGISPRDRQVIKLRETYFLRCEAMKARIACEQRMRQGLIGRIYLNDEGKYPQGELEEIFAAELANDAISNALRLEQGRRERALQKLVAEFDVYNKVFKNIEGVGAMIAVQLIAAVGDIRRFATVAKFKKYCGVSPTDEGAFMRRRIGEVASWKPDARQAFYLIGDQMNRRPNSEWGQKLLYYKQKMREVHPQVLCGRCDHVWNEDCERSHHKRKYGNSHIHKMATWRTITKFAERIYREWTKVYELQQVDFASGNNDAVNNAVDAKSESA